MADVNNRVEDGDGVGRPPVAARQHTPAGQLIRHRVDTLENIINVFI